MLEMNRYLAGLTCDGNEKDTFDQDTTERTMCKESSVDHTTCSVNSQDTDVDINLDSELISKDEVDLSKSKLFNYISYVFVQTERNIVGNIHDTKILFLRIFLYFKFIDLRNFKLLQIL